MKSLFLLRHAKSSWDNPQHSDFERPLSKRGISDAIIDGKTGLIARASDVSDITAKIDELLSNHKKRIALGKAGQRNAMEKFKWENKVKEYLNLIKKVKN